MPVSVIPMGADYEAAALQILKALRHGNMPAEIGYSGNAKKRLERANKSGAAFAVLVGEDVKLKNLATGEQEDITAEALPGLLQTP